MRSASKQSYRMTKSGTGIIKRIAEGFANAMKTTLLGAKALILAAAGGSTVAVDYRGLLLSGVRDVFL